MELIQTIPLNQKLFGQITETDLTGEEKSVLFHMLFYPHHSNVNSQEDVLNEYSYHLGYSTDFIRILIEGLIKKRILKASKNWRVFSFSTERLMDFHQ